MYIKNLKLINFRGAEDLPLELDKKLNVFVGVNGAGKSTILDSAAIMLSWFVNRLKNSKAQGRQIGEMDIRNGESSSGLEVTCFVRDFNLSWNIYKVRKGHAKKHLSALGVLNEAVKLIQDDITEKQELLNLPLLAFYPVNRVVLDIPLKIRTRHSFNLFSAYDDSLTSGADFRVFFEWFREREDLENENFKSKDALIKPDNFEYPDRYLETVRRALSEFMPDFTDLKVKRSPLRMVVKKNGKELIVNQLSDGEKCLIALIGDLARRLAIANPVLDDPLQGKGIILIDEVDLHLHPKWQQVVIPKLTQVFPNCQFLITTHSPHVITNVKPENLFMLDMSENGLSCHKPQESYGKTSNRVLEDLMGLETTRPTEIADELSELFVLIDQGQYDQAKEKIQNLQSEIGEDPDLVRASSLIRRKEIIGK